MAAEPPYLRLDGVVKRYGDDVAVAGVSLDVAQGEFVTLLGPSGSGKTTTLSMIAGFIRPTAGAIVLAGRHVESVPAHKRNIGVVFQDYALFPHMTVNQNVAFPLRQRKLSRTRIAEKTREALRMVNLGAFGDRYPSQLSGGQRQRVAVARAIVFDPQLLLMDEPLGALDRALRERLQIEIRRLHQELGVTILYVTHDQSEAFALSDRIAICNEGRIEQVGLGSQLYEHPETVFVASFLGESNIFDGTVVRSGNPSTIRCGELELRAPASSVGQGDSVAIVIRPERITLAAHTEIAPLLERGLNAVPGRVRELRYFGAERKLWIEIGEGLVALVSARADQRLEVVPGDAVVVTWPIAAANLLPRGASTSTPWAEPDGQRIATPGLVN
jgi:putative spermidine/putrescine transport system ATP-binding protein